MSEAKASRDTGRIGYIKVLNALVLLIGVRIFSMERILAENLTSLLEKEVKQLK
jgi:hypothetical protein